MKTLLTLTILLLPLLAFAEEDVLVSWTLAPGTMQDSFSIYHTNSAGQTHQLDIPALSPVNKWVTSHVVPHVVIGATKWTIQATCSFCVDKVGPISNEVTLVVESLAGPQAIVLDSAVVVDIEATPDE